MTMPPSPAGPPTAAGAPPKDIQTAFNLFIAHIVLGVLGAILSFALVGPIVDVALRQAGVRASDLGPQGQAQVEAAVRTGIIVTVIVAVVLLALYIFFVFRMRAGKNWARIVLTVLSALSVLSALFNFGSFGTFLNAGALGVISVIITIIQLILIITAVVFMYRPAANAYFTGAR
jgi:hypothetical protein